MLFQSIKTGFRKGLETLWFLSKIIIPVYVIVTILKYTPVMAAAGKLFNPLMGWFNLPGEAAIPFITGLFLDEYGAIAAMKTISLSSQHITTLAVMILFCHIILIETALMKKLGLNIGFFVALRFALAIIFGIIIGQLGAVLW
ncbi:MAG: nucleoside recognition protein [Clostridia bacterium]|nr:nucleoside recognition protein [Clostridia bacterium]